MTVIDSYSHSFPVVAGSFEVDPRSQQRVPLIKQVYGTAFSIGGKYFMTAGHVVKEARECDWWGIGFTDSTKWNTAFALDHEFNDSLDVGFVIADVPRANAFRWSIKDRPMLEQVITVGYPYAYDREQVQINNRAFSGHIVSTRKFLRLAGAPNIHELSFPCPRGLSGSPLLIPDHSSLIAGVVIGNEASEMLVYSDKETIKENGINQHTIVERYEALQLGIAVEGASLMDNTSGLLGCSLYDHLANNGLL